MALEEQEDQNPDVLPNNLFDDEPDDDWFDINNEIDIYIDRNEY